MDWTSKRSGYIRIFSILLSFLLLVSILTINVAAAEDDETENGPSATEEPAVTEEPPAQGQEAAEQPADSEEVPVGSNEEIIEVYGKGCVSGQVIVKFKNNTTDDIANSVIKSLDSEVKSEIKNGGLLLIDVPESETIESFIEALHENAFVEYVQPNYVYTLNQTVNDPYVSTKQWYLDKIRAYDAWDITMGDPDIKVAVIDTGIDLDHPEFAGKIYAQTDLVDYDGNAQDDTGHGTHVAGIIAATANNDTGIAGVAPNVKLIVVDVCGPSSASTADIAEGVYYSAEQGADVINISLGCYSNDTALEDAVQEAVSDGIIVVAAAGNDATSNAHYPSDYAPVISVTATDHDDEIVPISNYGSQKDISAPGILIYSTYTNSTGYTSMTGTSTASPMVAAVAALILSVNPDLSVSQVKDILYNTSVDLGDEGRDDYYGYGRLDAYAAVAAAAASVSAEQYTVSVEANNNAYGTVSGGGDYDSGTKVTVTAQPKTNCSFVKWTKDGQVVSTDVKYTFTVAANVTLTAVFEQVSSAVITSDIYTIDHDKKMIKNVTVNTTVEGFKAKLNNASGDVHIYDKNGNEQYNGIVASGMTAALVTGGSTQDELKISVLGDISGDGRISISDYTMIRLVILELSKFNQQQTFAADVNGDGKISIADYTLVRLHILKLSKID